MDSKKIILFWDMAQMLASRFQMFRIKFSKCMLPIMSYIRATPESCFFFAFVLGTLAVVVGLDSAKGRNPKIMNPKTFNASLETFSETVTASGIEFLAQTMGIVSNPSG